MALAPEGWRLFVQQTVEQNLRLGATVLADKRRVPALLDRVFDAVSLGWRSGGGSGRGRCPAASGRCWRPGGR